MQQQINPYNQDRFKFEFENTDLCKKLRMDFDRLIWDRMCIDFDAPPTPRERDGNKEYCVTRFYVSAFYYLNYLLEVQPKQIHDLGCGWNIFKKYIPQVIGVGPDPKNKYSHVDIDDFVDDDYVSGHKEFFESVFSINALHMVPISDIRKRVLDFASMIKPSGRGWISFNAQRMLDCDIDFVEKNLRNLEQTTEHYVRQQLSNLPYKLLVFDVFCAQGLDRDMNGNIHLVIQK